MLLVVMGTHSEPPYITGILHIALFGVVVVVARHRQMHFDTVNQSNPSYPKPELDLEGMKYEVITRVSSRE